MMNVIRGLFVTGTDTDVGKTIVTGALAAALRAENLNVGVWKPVQSGALLGRGETDAERLLQYSGIHERAGEVTSFTFQAPLTPMLAAKQEGVTITLQEIITAGQPLIHRYESVLIEGAGGVAVPLTEDSLVVDLISELRIPALIVARSGLGTINHTLLTVSYLQQHGVPIIGFILNDGDSNEMSNDSSAATNAELIERYCGISFLGRVPRLTGEINTELLIQLIREKIQLTPIRQAITVQSMGG
ncbi:dethiobiotin synthase [Paenibacillus sp. UMB7766-LJ446]|uniref:dethiobiotin synthase n=1 Tax=Paenibacillus sp. UMB7766-LJ446 TaxID=3046313 RepID=UPI00254C69D6|nr:dethiobiotin synthase [Paenibacillus sp. UMB7766-LJ446]MDK8193728.1 dethiobiotin synthase [Paenibacillus sp. UMB7766-LJ446]